MKRSPILPFISFAVAGFAVLWIVLGAELQLRRAAVTPAMPPEVVAPEPFITARGAHTKTTKIPALDQAKHLAFLTSVLENRRQTCDAKQACDAVARTTYRGGTASGGDARRTSCRNGNEHLMTIGPVAQSSEAEFPISVCSGTAFAQSTE